MGEIIVRVLSRPTLLAKLTWRKSLRRLRALPGDDRGVISILTVFAILLLVMLLGYVMNVGRQVDSKIRMQNAADAAAFSGGVVLARAMNALAFTNHLLCEIFALTAFMREAYFRNSYEYYRPDNPLYQDRSIFSAWDKAGELLSGAPLPKFSQLGRAIRQKVPLEKQLVDAYSAWAYAASIPMLPTLEMILAEELIPQYQQAVVTVFPEIAQQAAREIARLNSHPTPREGLMDAVLWRTDLEPVGGPVERVDRTLPVVLPQEDVVAFNTARLRRSQLAHHYLNRWNNVSLRFFDREAKMSQFAKMWRNFTCGYLEQLLNSEYPDRNLPAVLRPTSGSPEQLEEDYTFVAIVYRPKLTELASPVFRNPLEGDSLAYASVRLFVPELRLVWWRTGRGNEELGGVPGDLIIIDPGTPPAPDSPGRWEVHREPGASRAWSLFNQRWRVQLVPATCRNLAALLRTPPPIPAGWSGLIDVPNLSGVDTPELLHLSAH